MASLPHQITFDCADAYTLAQFWSQVFERPLHDDDHPGDPMALIPFEAGPGVLFIGVPEGNEFCRALAGGASQLIRWLTEPNPATPSLGSVHQYDGWEGSIWLTQADTPPPTCTELA